MTDAELKTLAKYVAEELRKQPMPVITATELAAKQASEEAERLRSVLMSRAMQERPKGLQGV